MIYLTTQRGFGAGGALEAGRWRGAVLDWARRLQVTAQGLHAAAEALLADLGVQDRGVGAAVVPPLVEVTLVRIDQALPAGVGQ